MTHEPNALLPCPFCGNDKPEIAHVHGDNWVICRTCHAATDMRNSREGATEKWNTRHPIQQAPACDAEHIRLFRQAFPNEQMCCVPLKEYRRLLNVPACDGLLEAAIEALNALALCQIKEMGEFKDWPDNDVRRIALDNLKRRIESFPQPAVSEPTVKDNLTVQSKPSAEVNESWATEYATGYAHGQLSGVKLGLEAGAKYADEHGMSRNMGSGIRSLPPEQVIKESSGT
jgi:Lar family restriction alleviation protein